MFNSPQLQMRKLVSEQEYADRGCGIDVSIFRAAVFSRWAWKVVEISLRMGATIRMVDGCAKTCFRFCGQ